MAQQLIGLLLGAEEDWPRAFEDLVGRLGPIWHNGDIYDIRAERLTIEPFHLRSKPRTDLVIDRLAHWYYHPREWLKKIALMDDVYLLNSPFTSQSMEKHSAYRALVQMGMHVPETVLVPYKNPLDNVRWAYASKKYNNSFDLAAVASGVGYPMFMKPFDGGAWRGVSMIRDEGELRRSYDESGEMLMHLQASVDNFEVFARALTIGPETMVMNFRPELPMHERYAVSYDFLTPQMGAETATIAQTVNAFFRWEFNSCEMLVKEGVAYQRNLPKPRIFVRCAGRSSVPCEFPKLSGTSSGVCRSNRLRPELSRNPQSSSKLAGRCTSRHRLLLGRVPRLPG